MAAVCSCSTSTHPKSGSVTRHGYLPAWSPDGRRLAFSTREFIRVEERTTTDSRLRIVDLGHGRRAGRHVRRPGARRHPAGVVDRWRTPRVLVGGRWRPAARVDGRRRRRATGRRHGRHVDGVESGVVAGWLAVLVVRPGWRDERLARARRSGVGEAARRAGANGPAGDLRRVLHVRARRRRRLRDAPAGVVDLAAQPRSDRRARTHHAARAARAVSVGVARWPVGGGLRAGAVREPRGVSHGRLRAAEADDGRRARSRAELVARRDADCLWLESRRRLPAVDGRQRRPGSEAAGVESHRRVLAGVVARRHAPGLVHPRLRAVRLRRRRPARAAAAGAGRGVSAHRLGRRSDRRPGAQC